MCDSCKCTKFTERILITGGAGFIGSHVVLLLTERYPDSLIINLDKLDYCASTEYLKPVEGKSNYKFIQGDICEPDFMRYIMQQEKIDKVLHFAAQSHVDLSFWSSLEFTHTNVYGTHVLVNAAMEAGVKLFLHVSTDEVYGGRSSVVLHEEAKLHPTNPYAASKAAAECMVLSYWESFKFPVIITRANNVYGPHQYPEKVIPKFILRLQRGMKCCVHGGGNTVRNFLHTDDIAEAFDVILHNGTAGEIYNIGTDFEIATIDLAKELISRIKGISSEEEQLTYIEHVEDRPFNDRRYPMDRSKLEKLGWHPKVSWEEGITSTIRWYMDTDNLTGWPGYEAALTPYPHGSNTMRLAPSNTQSLS